MLSAILLLCAPLDTGELYCTSISSLNVSFTFEECLEDLAAGFIEAESGGWDVVSYGCYDWEANEDLIKKMNIHI